MPETHNSPAPAGEMIELQPYDVMDDRRAVVARLAGSDEIDALTSTIDVSDMSTIVTFGSGAAEAVSKASDAVLRGMTLSGLNDSGDTMEALSRIMSRFSAGELDDRPEGLMGRLFGGARKTLDRALDKYRTMGDEVDKIYVQLRRYESEIQRSNDQLEALFEANVRAFHELEKYIVAGEQGCREIEAYKRELEQRAARTRDPMIGFELQTINQALTMLEQRTQDLRLSEAVALQAIPMIRTIQFNNLRLVQKIHSAFIVTLPVFKQALAQAILMKRQKLQSDALGALDARTNELVRRNAVAAAEQAKLSARLAAADPGRAASLEDSWRAITGGIEETKRLQADAQAQRDRDRAQLERIKAMGGGSPAH